jgi:hypothetical protein
MSPTIARLLFFTLPAVVALQCTHTEQEAEGLQEGSQSNVSEYWHQGKAEVSRFDLEQVRYGESHPGHAVLIFVKEQFLPDAQVKFDGLESQESPVDVLKHIATRRFYTGIYPYSMMTTVFSPFASSQHGAYKITGTTQDWCGQTFMQLNSRDGRFAIQYHSYFQEEGDREFTIDGALLEDDLWSMVRTNPDKLPVGEISIFPSTHCVQLRIREFYPHDAIGRLEKSLDPSISADSISVYTVRYSDIPRTLSIMFEPSFPYAILAWEETEDNVAERNGTPPLRTRGVRTHSLMLDYWNRSSGADSTYRSILGLD